MLEGCSYRKHDLLCNGGFQAKRGKLLLGHTLLTKIASVSQNEHLRNCSVKDNKVLSVTHVAWFFPIITYLLLYMMFFYRAFKSCIQISQYFPLKFSNLEVLTLKSYLFGLNSGTATCSSLGKLLKLSVPQFYHLENGKNK